MSTEMTGDRRADADEPTDRPGAESAPTDDQARRPVKRRESRWRRARRWILRVLAGILIALVVLASIVLYRTWRFQSRQPVVSPADALMVDVQAASERLAQSLRFRTVTENDGAAGIDVFAPLHAFLQAEFPHVHRTMKREIIGERSLLYTWSGSDPQSRPIILLGHMDVVPAQPENLDRWTHPPFAGTVADGYIWGRGALDDKVAVLGLLESAEALIASGFQPRRTIYLAFGHDEEGGSEGAKAIAKTLRTRDVMAQFALDEGMIITRGVMEEIDAPLATIGIAEKGYLTIEMTAHADSGHSSVPPDRTAVGALSRAIARLEAHPMPASLDGPIRHTLAYLGPEMPFVQRMAMANLWLLGGVVQGTFDGDKNTRAMIRTTTAPTMLKAGTKANVMPPSATSTVNFRILPGDTVAEVVDHVRRVVNDDRVTVEVLIGNEPSRVSRPDSAAFKLLQRTTRQVFSGAVVVPSLVVGATDGRFYEGVADDVYRFLPVIFLSDDIARLHGHDERISTEGYGRAIQFYTQLINNLQDF